jgi:hypothetical protein
MNRVFAKGTIVAVLVGLMAIGIGASAAGARSAKHKAKNRISVHGPTKNAFHVYFDETVSGSASGAANYVISGEQLNPAGGCASSYTVESTRSDWYQWPTGTGSVHGKFSLVAKFWSRNHSRHGICSYLINSSSKKTFAHASRFWTNA